MSESALRGLLNLDPCVNLQIESLKAFSHVPQLYRTKQGQQNCYILSCVSYFFAHMISETGDKDVDSATPLKSSESKKTLGIVNTSVTKEEALFQLISTIGADSLVLLLNVSLTHS